MNGLVVFICHILYLALFLCFVGLIYINRYWWPACPIYHKIEVYSPTTGHNDHYMINMSSQKPKIGSN